MIRIIASRLKSWAQFRLQGEAHASDALGAVAGTHGLESFAARQSIWADRLKIAARAIHQEWMLDRCRLKNRLTDETPAWLALCINLVHLVDDKSGKRRQDGHRVCQAGRRQAAILLHLWEDWARRANGHPATMACGEVSSDWHSSICAGARHPCGAGALASSGCSKRTHEKETVRHEFRNCAVSRHR